MDDWKVFQVAKISKLSDDTKLACIEDLEYIMPLALARPFVKDFITDSMKVKVRSS